MNKNIELSKYSKYLEKLNSRLKLYFERQKAFIKCKQGCDICCKNSYFPTSFVEYSYIQEVFSYLSKEQTQAIQDKALKIYKDRKKFIKSNNIMDFSYECPFLKNGVCQIYQARPMLCRAHGLVFHDFNDTKSSHAPFCMNLGLNYANVYDKNKKNFSLEKAEILNIKEKPEIYDISLSAMMRDAKCDFGEVRMIFEWVLFDIPNFEKLIKE
jgi:Fe-S-cluster containining protein